MKNACKIFTLIIILTVNISCHRNNPKLFTSLDHSRTGIGFKNSIQETENFNVIDYVYLYDGGGVATGDINNDGLADIFFCGNFARSKLYLNKGNFRFEDISEKAGISGHSAWNTGVTMADINADGLLDIYACSSTDGRADHRKNLLFINNGDLTFSEKAEQYGIADTSYSIHSAFFDYDKDGDLDLFVLNHSLNMMTKKEDEPEKDTDPEYVHRLYKNTGGKFVDANKESGMIGNEISFGLGLAVSDFNDDGWPDIYICNDFFIQDQLYINQKNGTFSDQIEKFFDHRSFSSMGSDAADFNNDGYIDLVTLDMLPEDNYEQKLVAAPDHSNNYPLLKNSVYYHQATRNMLQMSNHGEYFTEIGQYSGIFSTNWSWAPLLCDFDNDGNKDLYITTGFGKNNTNMDFIKFTVDLVKKRQAGQAIMTKLGIIDNIPATRVKNYLFKNNGDLTYTNVTDSWGDEIPSLSNGAAYADFDNDGDMDLVVNNINDYAFIYRNNSNENNKNHYLKVKFEGSGLNKAGIGAKVTVRCKEHSYTQEFMPSRGYMSSMNHELIFGVGSAEIIDELRVTWPDLREQVLKTLKTNETIVLRNDDALTTGLPDSKSESIPLFIPVNNGNLLAFRHTENDYVDFTKQILLPHLLSTQGPHIAKSDVNNDGLEDLYFSGAKDSPGKLYFQKKNGSFELQKQACFETDKACEDIGVLFFDADGDKDPDLYVVSGGNEFPAGSPFLQDRLYLNNGNGLFSKSSDRIPETLSSGSCVKAADIDNDGDLDLFVGGRVTPGSYPLAPRSYILENNGGYFKDVTSQYNKSLMNPGMVTDAVWTDFNGDKLVDLIIVGEWMGIRAFQHSGNNLTEISETCGLKDTEGWWNTIIAEDFDRDGDMDYAAGNLGLNSQIKVSVTEPATIYAKDFDNNGSIDPVMCYYLQGKSYPIYSKDDLSEQLPFINKKYASYTAYASQSITDIFSAVELRDAPVMKASLSESCYLENQGNNKFRLTPLPCEAQYSPIYCLNAGDFNNDGNTDLILGGNFFGTRIRFGDYDANKGLMLTGNGKGNFAVMGCCQSGFHIKGEVRDITEVKLASGGKMMVFALNNDSVRLFRTDKVR